MSSFEINPSLSKSYLKKMVRSEGKRRQDLHIENQFDLRFQFRVVHFKHRMDELLLVDVAVSVFVQNLKEPFAQNSRQVSILNERCHGEIALTSVKTILLMPLTFLSLLSSKSLQMSLKQGMKTNFMKCSFCSRSKSLSKILSWSSYCEGD